MSRRSENIFRSACDTFPKKKGHGGTRTMGGGGTSLSRPVVSARQFSELAEEPLEPLTLGIRERSVFGSAFELEADEEIEFAGGKRSAFDSAAEKVPQQGGTLEGVPGGFRGVGFPRILGAGRFERRLGFPGRPLEGRAAHPPGDGPREITVTLRKTRGSEADEERAEGLLRGVFPGESGIALAHAADGRVQHGEKQENEEAVGNGAGKLRPGLKQFEEE